MNISYHTLLDYIVLNVPLYMVGSQGPQLCKSTSLRACVCVCVVDKCEFAVVACALFITAKGKRREKKEKSATTFGQERYQT